MKLSGRWVVGAVVLFLISGSIIFFLLYRDWQGKSKIRTGMTVKEVEAILGKPYQERIIGPAQVQRRWLVRDTDSYLIDVRFKDGKVNSYEILGKERTFFEKLRQLLGL